MPAQNIVVNPREIVKTNLSRCTVSSVADLLGCAKKFEELRIRRNWPNDGPMDTVERGKALHAVMRELYVSRSDGEVPIHHLKAIVDRAVKRANYSPDTDRARERERVAVMARAFVEGDDWEDIAGTLGIEVSVEYDLISQGRALIKLSARLDRVLVRASEPTILVVRDYKSGAIRIDLAEVYVMLRAAKHKYRGYERYLLELDGLDSDDRVVRERVDYDECRDQHDFFRMKAVEVLTRGYDTGEWPASPGSCCTYCQIREKCQGLPDDDIDNF